MPSRMPPIPEATIDQVRHRADERGVGGDASAGVQEGVIEPALGGRVAEMRVSGGVPTGAEDDLQRATSRHKR